MKLKKKVNSAFITVDDYFNFCLEQSKIQERPIFGGEAVKLKKKMDGIIPLPKIYPNKKATSKE